jgi:hypothetical protein
LRNTLLKTTKKPSFSGLFWQKNSHFSICNELGMTGIAQMVKLEIAITEYGKESKLSRQMGTSVAMLERHYSKLTATMAAARLG